LNETKQSPQTADPAGGSRVSFVEEVMKATPGESHLDMCIQCGTCGGSCPSGADMDHTPRSIFAMVREDMRDEVYSSNTYWYCISCYYCTVRCPQDVHITDLMYTLKSLAHKAGYAKNKPYDDFSLTFNHFVVNNGRAFEFGVATLPTMKHLNLRNIPGLAEMGVGMMLKQKMSLVPKKIKGLDGLQKILKRADEIEEKSR
jgi:heterodisulfide reductase subunit C